MDLQEHFDISLANTVLSYLQVERTINQVGYVAVARLVDGGLTDPKKFTAALPLAIGAAQEAFNVFSVEHHRGDALQAGQALIVDPSLADVLVETVVGHLQERL